MAPPGKSENPATSPRLLMAPALPIILPPKLPRSRTEPSDSQSTACGPKARPKDANPVFAQVPDEPTAWPRSLIPSANPTVSPLSGAVPGSRRLAPKGRLQNRKLEKRWHSSPLVPSLYFPLTRLSGLYCSEQTPGRYCLPRWEGVSAPRSIRLPGIPMSAVTANVFAIRIGFRSLGVDRRVAPGVRPIRRAVWSAQCAELVKVAAIPNEGLCGSVLNQVRGPGDVARGADAVTGAKVPAQRPEVGDGVAGRF